MNFMMFFACQPFCISYHLNRLFKGSISLGLSTVSVGENPGWRLQLLHFQSAAPEQVASYLLAQGHEVRTRSQWHLNISDILCLTGCWLEIRVMIMGLILFLLTELTYTYNNTFLFCSSVVRMGRLGKGSDLGGQLSPLHLLYVQIVDTDFSTLYLLF